MKTIKFTAAKTENLQRAINLLDMHRLGSTLKSTKEAAAFAGLELEGRTFKAVYPQLVAFYENALNEEEAETLTITVESSNAVEDKEVTAKEKIESEVAKVVGTWVKRANARKNLIDAHNRGIQSKIDNVCKKIRALISRPEQEKRELYSIKSQLTRQLVG